MLIINICCAYNISMSLAKFSMAVNRILHIFVSKRIPMHPVHRNPFVHESLTDYYSLNTLRGATLLSTFTSSSLGLKMIFSPPS